MTDVQGVEHRPLDDPQTRAVALVFILSDCPIANSYAPELNRLYEQFSGAVQMVLVHTDPQFTPQMAREHAKQFQLLPPVLIDREHHLVKQTGVTITPEAAVLSPAGELLYRGRVDDRYVDLGKRRANVTSRDLHDALQAITAGQSVAQPRTAAIGCYIPDLPTGDSPHE